MTPHGWQIVEAYLNKLGDVFTLEVDGVLYQLVAEVGGTGQYLVTPPDGEWAHRVWVMPAPDANGIVWRVPTADGRTALFPRTCDEAIALVAREHAPSKLAVDMAGLAAQARRLSVAMRAARDGADTTERHLMYRLADAAGRVDDVARVCDELAAALLRYHTRPERPCAAPWGVCPEHGSTLQRFAAAGTRCREGGCTRVWDHDREGEPCTEPASHRVRAHGGSWVHMCAGHLLALQKVRNARGALVEPLTDPS